MCPGLGARLVDLGALRSVAGTARARRKWPAVDSKRASDGADGPETTLGELLYADRDATPPPETEWVQLVASIGAGDQQALRALYERSHRLVFTLARRICNDRAIAEEVTLDVFHDVWRRSVEYDPGGGTVVGWIMMLARSRSIDRVRFEHRKKRVDPYPTDGQERAEASRPGDARDARDRSRSLFLALTELTPNERETIKTAFFSERTYAETAAHLEEPLGTVKTRVRSALAKLRKALEREGGDR